MISTNHDITFSPLIELLPLHSTTEGSDQYQSVQPVYHPATRREPHLQLSHAWQRIRDTI